MFALALTVLAGCAAPGSPGATAIPAGTSGIEGQVTIGPMCPVVMLNDPCPDQPYQATMDVLDASGEQVAQFQSDTQGRFKVALAPGVYTIRPQGEGITRAPQQDVTVVDGQFAPVEIIYDSGIR
ncbi:MAG: carboxypeptidase regulatory-like domain-containing protein [Chloroflexi bacterium]|nr:carboxypeptidase regulatory-like domain-containing protein [Chloroflexota bacterium]